MTNVLMWTDGSVYPNPGPGGWVVILKHGEYEREITGVDPLTTNNRMELMGPIIGLEALKVPCSTIIYCDSQYVVKTVNDGWARNKNHDLWQRLDQALIRHTVAFVWVKGHADDVMNNRADRLAEAARLSLVLPRPGAALQTVEPALARGVAEGT